MPLITDTALNMKMIHENKGDYHIESFNAYFFLILPEPAIDKLLI